MHSSSEKHLAKRARIFTLAEFVLSCYTRKRNTYMDVFVIDYTNCEVSDTANFFRKLLCLKIYAKLHMA